MYKFPSPAHFKLHFNFLITSFIFFFAIFCLFVAVVVALKICEFLLHVPLNQALLFSIFIWTLQLRVGASSCWCFGQLQAIR